ncbi:MAG: hypothetical protein WA693_20940, partial [Pseudolabrys sp.]
ANIPAPTVWNGPWSISTFAAWTKADIGRFGEWQLFRGRCLNAQKDQYFFEPWQGDVERERTARGAIQLGDDPHSPDVWQSAAPLGSPQP